MGLRHTHTLANLSCGKNGTQGIVDLIEAFAVLPLPIRSRPDFVESIVHDCNEKVQHQDDDNDLVDAPEGHRHDVRKLQGEVFFRRIFQGREGVVFHYEHLVRAVSIEVSPKEDMEE